MAGTDGLVSMETKLTWTKWHRVFHLWPKRSINDRLIFGPINTSHRNVWGLGAGPRRIRRFATDKELFLEKLKGKT